MNIVELNQKEVSVISGGFTFGDAGNYAGAAFGIYVNFMWIVPKMHEFDNEHVDALVNVAVVAASQAVGSWVGCFVGNIVDYAIGWKS